MYVINDLKIDWNTYIKVYFLIQWDDTIDKDNIYWRKDLHNTLKWEANGMIFNSSTFYTVTIFYFEMYLFHEFHQFTNLIICVLARLWIYSSFTKSYHYTLHNIIETQIYPTARLVFWLHFSLPNQALLHDS